MATLTGQVRNGDHFDRLFSVDNDNAEAVAQLDKAILGEVLAGRTARVIWAANGEEHTLYEVTPISDWPEVVILERPGYRDSFNAEIGPLVGDVDFVRVSRLQVGVSNYGIQTTSYGAITAPEAQMLGRLYGIAANYLTRRLATISD